MQDIYCPDILSGEYVGGNIEDDFCDLEILCRGSCTVNEQCGVSDYF